MDTDSKSNGRFLETLRRSQLLSPEEIDPFIKGRHLIDADDATLAREFLKSQLLTPFQAKYVLHGRWRGLVIGDYRIHEPISSGGMGEIYLARRSGIDEPVAIKVLRTELRDERRTVDRFRLEAFAVMSLKHPNLLRGIEYDTIASTRKETHYLVTEFVAGPNLYELTVIRRQLPWQQACDLIGQAARGLDHAHRHGFIHRDVKPGNLIVSSSGAVKVVDFGLAQHISPDSTFKFSLRKRRGTQRYAAPEQSKSNLPIDRRSDIYSLGCSLFFALCGRPPSDSSPDLYPSSRDAMKRILSHRKDLPGTLLKILQRMLRRDPELRYETAEQVADALAPLAKRLTVDVNYPALLRAREKARRSQASWNTGDQAVQATQSADRQATMDSQQSDSLASESASDSIGAVVKEPEPPFDSTAQPRSLDRFADIYRRHRQHIDRLNDRIATLEQSLRASQTNEVDLRTDLRAGEIERQQIALEHEQTIVELEEKLKHALQNSERSTVEMQQAQIGVLQRSVRDLNERLETSERERTQAEQLAQSYASQLAEVVARANALSAEFTNIFGQIASDQAEQAFAEDYRRACNAPGQSKLPTEKLSDESIPRSISDEQKEL